MIALGFGIGWMLGGPGFDTRRALALGTGQRNIAAVDPPAKADSGDDRGEIVIEQDQGGGFARNVRACVLPDGAFRLVQGEPKGVQRTTGSGRVSTRWVCRSCRGTKGSNPSLSSGESGGLSIPKCRSAICEALKN